VAGDRDRYVAALRFPALTGLYDPLIRLTTRESEFKRRLLELALAEPRQRILDLGCGTGTLAIATKQARPDAEVVGLDGDPAILSRARQKAAAAGVEIEFREGLADELPFEEDSFDLVLSTLFFHHLGSAAKRRTADEIARVLEPGGALYVADWGPPQDRLMALASLGIRLLDGFEPTRENFAGALPVIFAGVGLEPADGPLERLRTAFGSLAFYSATAAR